ncbi:MAG: outer membrane protein OmpA-like peptidoglycan-associated protein [Maribacter sp.]|jgi:outer membrane protein OmpA-like peptidoglycan-associated protein
MELANMVTIKLKNMRSIFFYMLLSVVFVFQNLNAQEDFSIPPAVKTIDYANRELTFSEVRINGQQTTYLAVEKGETVKIKTRITSKRVGDYCPGCIVQVYWGIRDYTSVCAKSFGGYRFTKKKSKHTFNAPMKEGIYYITMGGSLEYSCKNNNQRPKCEAEYAFAVLKVGTPDPEKKITLKKLKTEDSTSLKTTLVKSGHFGKLNKIEWFFEGEKLSYDDQEEIPVSEFGTYRARWSNCLTSVEESIDYISNDQEIPDNPPVVQDFSDEKIESKPAVTQDSLSVDLVKDTLASDSTDIAVLIEKNDKFVLKNLIFDLDKAAIRPEAKTVLNQLAQIMKNQPTIEILLEGHTAIGNARQNRILSERRVASTKKYLVMKGVAKSNIQTKGWGQRKPLIVTKDIEKGRINRRVEIQILAR